MTTPQGMLAQSAQATPMSDHIAAFWHLLETEHVRILVDIRVDHDDYPEGGPRYHWDSASFSNEFAKALITSRQAAAPQGREALDDLKSHRSTWHDALKAMLDNANKGPLDIDNQRSYWKHELRAFNRAFDALDSLTPAVAPEWWETGALLSEQERHAVGHARYQVDHATPDDPECCFDYELVATLIGVVERLALTPAITPTVAPGSEHRKWTQECCTPITPAVAPDAGAGNWRCFHCDDVFTDKDAAREHFGDHLQGDPACKLNAMEGGLLKLVRDQEDELQQRRQEDTASYREFYSLGSDHAIGDDNEDCIGLARIPPRPFPQCEAITPARLYKEKGACPYEAKFKTTDGKQLCQIHAELWAAERSGGRGA